MSTAHTYSKDGTWVYNCKYRLTQKVLCPATARVVSSEEKWILSSGTDNHTCEPNRARVISESLRCKMKDLVQSSQDLKFDSLKCHKEFSCNTQLQSHISQKHEGSEDLRIITKRSVKISQ